MMARLTTEYLSIKITQFLMRTVGFWNAETNGEQLFLNCMFVYMLAAIAVALCVEGLDFYYSWGDFYAITYTACSTMPVIIILIKVIVFVRQRDQIMRCIKYTQQNFWHRDYDEYGRYVLNNVDKKGVLLVCSFQIFVFGTVATYMLAPIVENIGKNETDRVLPFKIWIDVPSTTTPYFEIFFVIETLSLVHSGICFCCFDNFLTLLCIHAAGQFKILQQRLKTIFDSCHAATSKDGLTESEMGDRVYDEFRGCVLQHRTLIQYVQKLESMFSLSTLCQLLISSVMLCVAGFQVCVARGSFVRRMIFVAHTAGCFFQLFAVTVTMNELIVESRAVGDAIYASDWQSHVGSSYANLRKSVLFVILRSRRPCYITAGGFAPVSLETFMAVLSTAASYFTLLRNLEET